MENRILDEVPKPVESHLNMIQNVIQRMSVNSTSCKTWCITLVSALLVLVKGDTNSNYIFISIIPIILFLTLDTYYLGLEKRFINSHNTFIRKIHTNALEVSDLFAIIPTGSSSKFFFKSLMSFSVWPFYTTLTTMVIIAKFLLK